MSTHGSSLDKVTAMVARKLPPPPTMELSSFDRSTSSSDMTASSSSSSLDYCSEPEDSAAFELDDGALLERLQLRDDDDDDDDSEELSGAEGVYDSDLETDLREKARLELNEDPDRRPQCIDTIRRWIEQHDTIYSRTDDEFILRFLRTCKFDLDKTKKRLNKYYAIRHSTPEWFARTEENLRVVDQLIDERLGVYMNFVNDCEDAIIIVKPGLFDYKRYDIKYIGAAVVLIAETLLADVRVQVSGVQFVVDCNNMGLGLVMQITPTMLYKFVNCWQNIMPVRLKGIHILNANPVVNKLLVIAKYCLNKKLRERFYVHDSSRKSFQDLLSPEWIPMEYGGTAGSEVTYTNILKEVFANGKDYLLNDEQYGMYKFPE